MSDVEIMALPEWDGELNRLTENFRNEHRREPSPLELANLMEILINRFRAFGLLIPPTRQTKRIEPEKSNDIGIGM
jgi:hypothetical protein